MHSRQPFPSACRGKGLLRSPPGASNAPSGFQGSEQVLNLSKSKRFPLDFGEPPIQNNPGDRDGLGLITRDTGPVRGRKDTAYRQARGTCSIRVCALVMAFSPWVLKIVWGRKVLQKPLPECSGQNTQETTLLSLF